MSEFVSIVFCRNCGSRFVEIKKWENASAIIYCRTCNNSCTLPGFTLGRCQVAKKDLDIARNNSAGINEFEK